MEYKQMLVAHLKEGFDVKTTRKAIGGNSVEFGRLILRQGRMKLIDHMSTLIFEIEGMPDNVYQLEFRITSMSYNPNQNNILRRVEMGECFEVVLKSLVETEALVPYLWHLESTNVLTNAQKRGIVGTTEVERILSLLECLPIQVDPLASRQAFSRALARAYNLSSYDAAYLELALRETLPLATLDKNLAEVARKSDVPNYLSIRERKGSPGRA